jgi:putative PIN family toxin of toxin-antitoxin system
LTTPVVFDINVLVGAVVEGVSDFTSFPSPPPVTGHAQAECIGIINDASEDEFALWLSPHILTNVARVLRDEEGFQWEDEKIEEYLELLVASAEASGGGVRNPPRKVHDCADPEDNRILDLGLDSGAQLIVTSDQHLLELSPWHHTVLIIEPSIFVNRVDVMRRARRRK